MSTDNVIRTPQDAVGYDANAKQKAQAKTSRIPIKVIAAEALKKPDWIRVKAGSPTTRFYEIKQILREHKLHTVCEEASCPNIGECFGKGTATFMVMGDKCTRRCPFCDVGHGRPDPLDLAEPLNLARTIAALNLKYVVITSVDRDDLRDGGAGHFVECIRRVREMSPATRIEILTPDFRGRMDRALDILKAAPPDVMNHNLETIPRLYKEARPGSDYAFSLNLLKRFKDFAPGVPTKSGLMVGLGETDDEILEAMRDMREHGIDMLTIGQYLAPSGHHLPVRRYVHPETFKMFEREAGSHGFHTRRRRSHGALELSRRPASPCGGRAAHTRLNNHRRRSHAAPSVHSRLLRSLGCGGDSRHRTGLDGVGCSRRRARCAGARRLAGGGATGPARRFPRESEGAH